MKKIIMMLVLFIGLSTNMAMAAHWIKVNNDVSCPAEYYDEDSIKLFWQNGKMQGIYFWAKMAYPANYNSENIDYQILLCYFNTQTRNYYESLVASHYKNGTVLLNGKEAEWTSRGKSEVNNPSTVIITSQVIAKAKEKADMKTLEKTYSAINPGDFKYLCGLLE
ncbi:hypothetical protein SELR_pSRC300710 (plasmid) [Selenomonas ruminantium subsp. lactilytica TAM6421]|uniref:Uncharacterized protein n=1 Tax=Selenomonas ruminantium subsp. lactilytica (strain NBRC 103574 / TAM6421) TaxID=927704 RepID=I0GWK7_SELRL|nr:hypothetical protein [Selenomonas ruminantium]BAL85144.1 hypothetical protein SELR_pSRC300710 [Selenomonas ruminantium subsp. lactilytica TAM6421]